MAKDDKNKNKNKPTPAPAPKRPTAAQPNVAVRPARPEPPPRPQPTTIPARPATAVRPVQGQPVPVTARPMPKQTPKDKGKSKGPTVNVAKSTTGGVGKSGKRGALGPGQALMMTLDAVGAAKSGKKVPEYMRKSGFQMGQKNVNEGKGNIRASVDRNYRPGMQQPGAVQRRTATAPVGNGVTPTTSFTPAVTPATPTTVPPGTPPTVVPRTPQVVQGAPAAAMPKRTAQGSGGGGNIAQGGDQGVRKIAENAVSGSAGKNETRRGRSGLRFF